LQIRTYVNDHVHRELKSHHVFDHVSSNNVQHSKLYFTNTHNTNANKMIIKIGFCLKRVA